MIVDQAALTALEARELRAVAIHEAAHMVILRRFGGYGVAEIWRNPSGNPAEHAWLGHCKRYASPGEIDHSNKPVRLRPKKSVKWNVFYGLAGEAAEIMDGAQDDEEAAVELFHFFVNSTHIDEMSDTDREVMGVDWISYHTAKRMVAMLREHWADVLMEANCLMEWADADGGSEQ